MTPFSVTEIAPAEVVDGADATRLPLATRVRAGFSWTVSSSLIGELLRFLRSVVLARLLVPEDFGLFGMALTVLAALNSLTTMGLDRTIVSNKFDTGSELKTQLDTVWSAELIRSLIVALLVSASAFPVSRFYGQSKLTLIIPVLGLTTFVQGFQNIGLVILRKEISFRRIFWYELVTNLAGIVLTIALAVVMRNVWALAIGLLLTAVLGTVLSYIFHPYRPRLSFEKAALGRALSLGKFVLVIAVASYLNTMADNIMVGRLLGTSALGNYSLAYNIASAPVSVLIFAMATVLFPAYAEMALEQPQRLERALVKVFSISALILIVITLPLFLFAGEIVQLLFGSKWTSAGAVLSILALIIPLRGLTQIVSTVFYAVNRPKHLALGRILEALIFLGLLYPMIKSFGLMGVAWAGLITYVFAFLNRLMGLGKILPGIAPKLFQISFITLVAAGSGLLAATLSLSFLSSTLPRVMVGGLLSAIIPAAVLLLIQTDLRKWLLEWVH